VDSILIPSSRVHSSILTSVQAMLKTVCVLSRRRFYSSVCGVETFLSSAGCTRSLEHGALVPPIHLSTSYERDEDGYLREFNYSRLGNPTRSSFEKTFCELEGGEESFAFSSGMAAATAIFLAGHHNSC
jgi:cystathionine beta-lyase/cystathionine gamma-synthase